MTSTKQPGTDTARQHFLAAVAGLVAITAVYSVRAADPDLWGHLCYGRLFVETGQVQVTDPFAYTTAGLTWQAHEYLTQILLWLAYATAGSLGLIALKCLVGGGAVYILYRSIRLWSDDARLWAPILMLLASLLGRYFLFRPQLFTFLWFGLFVLILHRRLSDRPAPLWVLPPVQALWANLHGGFVAGIGAIGLALALRCLQSYYRHGLRLMPLWRDTRALLAALAGCLAATLLTPMGWQLWSYLLTELTDVTNGRFIFEWQPVDIGAPDWSEAMMLAMLALLVTAWGLAERRGAAIAGVRPWQWLLSSLPLTIMAFQSNRHIPILVIWVAPVLTLLAQAIMDARGETRALRRGLLVVTSLIGLPTLLGVILVLSDPLPRIRVTDDSLGSERPFGAVAFMQANELRGNVYTPLWWGSYLTWELYPEVLVSGDNRNVTLFPPDMVSENLSFYNAETADPDAPLHYATDFLLMPSSTPILPRLRADSRWTVIYEDPDAILFARADMGTDSPRRRRAGELTLPVTSPPQFLR